LRRLDEVAETTSGGTPNRSVSEYYGGRIPWIKSGELNDGLIDQAEESITDEGLRNSSARITPKGTLVIALYGATVGKTGILKIDAATNQAVCAIIPKNGEIKTQFLFWFFRHKRPEFLKNSFGGAQPNISQRILRETKLPVPPIELQLVVCNFLEIVEKRQNGQKDISHPGLPSQFSEITDTVIRIEELAARIEEARELRRQAVEETDALFKKVLINAFSLYSNETVAIGDAFNVTTGGTPSRANPLFWGGDVKWVSSGEVAFCRIGDTFEKITELGLENSNAHLYPPNTVLIAMIGQGKTRGQCAILDCYATTNQNVAGIHVYETEHLPEFVYWWLFSRYTESRSTEIGTAQPALSGTRVKQMPIPLPSIHEQSKVVKYLNDMQSRLDTLKRHQAETAAALDALLPAVLERAFRGEL
jgi:type I restriction enzyme S subunit